MSHFFPLPALSLADQAGLLHAAAAAGAAANVLLVRKRGEVTLNSFLLIIREMSFLTVSLSLQHPYELFDHLDVVLGKIGEAVQTQGSVLELETKENFEFKTATPLCLHPQKYLEIS